MLSSFNMFIIAGTIGMKQLMIFVLRFCQYIVYIAANAFTFAPKIKVST